MFFNYFGDLWNNYSLGIITAFIVFLFITFILDNLKLSDDKFLRLIQDFMLGFLFFYLYFKFFSLSSVYTAEKPLSSDPVLSTNVNINKGLLIV